MPSSRLKLYGASTRSLKVDLVASFADVELEKPPFTMGITNKTPRYLAMNPLGKVTVPLQPGSMFQIKRSTLAEPTVRSLW